MALNSFVEREDSKRVDWMVNFDKKVLSYQTKYHLTDEQILDVQNGTVFAREWLDYKNGLEKHLSQVIEYNYEQLNGVAAGATASQMPEPPAVPTLAAPVPGTFARYIAMGKGMKTQIGFTLADGKDLALIGSTITVDRQNKKPLIKLRLISGGHPEVVWKKQGMDGIEIYKDSGDGNFVLLAYSTYPNYTDTTALPATGKSAIWKYKAIYKYRDVQAGQWSDVISIAVAGN